MNPFFLGGVIGACAMYFLDRQSGRRRRARTRDQMVHAARVLSDAGKVTARDAAHRAQGIVAGARQLIRVNHVTDEVLVERVSAALGRTVSHPHAIQVAARSGEITLEGPVLAAEVRQLMRAVRHVPGVRGITDRLVVHQEAGNVSSLQGGVPRPGYRFEFLQANWSPSARLAAGGAGAALLLAAMRARGGLYSLLGLAGGGGLLARAATNFDLASLVGLGRRAIAVQKVINVAKPVEEVFAFWSDYERFPRYSHNIREVKRIGENQWRWTVAGPAGVPVNWTTEITRVVPNERIEWRSTQQSEVWHQGCVRFEANGNGGTRINVQLSYIPPAGAIGHAVASLFGADPKSEMDADLMRMKTTIETGHAPHDAAMH